MTRNQLIDAIRDANNHDTWSELVTCIKRSDDANAFATIFAHSVERQSMDAAVYDAAKLLYESNVTCRLDCDSAILAMLSSWDISIEEVPWYLANQFGAEVINRHVENLLELSMDDAACTILKSIRYWVGLCPRAA